jgi:hypothetical protein
MAKKLTDRSFELAAPATAADELLDVARQVFGEQGFTGARSAGTLAGAAGCRPGEVPVDDLYVTLWQDHHAAHRAAARAAVAEARQAGLSGTSELFEVGARAFLQGSWQRRDLALLFSSGDAPDGFDALRRRHRLAWLRSNTALLRVDDSPEERLLVASLTSTIGRGGYEVATAGDFRQAKSMIDAVIGYTRLLTADRPRAAHRPSKPSATLRAVGPA